MISAWTELKALFNSDIDNLILENKSLELENQRLVKECERCHKEYDDFVKYRKECDQRVKDALEKINFDYCEMMNNRKKLTILENSDLTAKELRNQEEIIKRRYEQIEQLESQLKIANDRATELEDFVKTLPDSYKYAYDLYVKSKSENRSE